MSTNTILASAPLTSTGYHLKANGTTLGNSLIWDNGTNVGIGNTNTSYTLDVSGSTRTSATQPSLLINYTDATSYANLIFTESGTNKGVIQFIGSTFATTARRNNFEIVNGANSDMTLWTNNIERLRITSAGNVGIGTSSPSYKLETVAITAAIAAFATTSASGGFLQFRYNTSSAFGYIGSGNQLATGSAVTDFAFANDAGNIVFATTGAFTERMRITSGGNVFIGYVNAGVTDTRMYISGQGTTSSTYSLVVKQSNNTVDLLVIRDDGYGYLKAAAWAYGSDRRIKENINYITTGLDKVMALKPATFDYIDGVKNNIGWIAQDVEEVIPEAVGTISENNDQLTLKSDFIVPYLVKAIQEMNTKLDEQNQTIQNLQEQINILAK